MIHRSTLCLAGLLALCVASGVRAGDAVGEIHGDQDGGKISRHLYGHFAEHLGRCIYDGIWVGEDSAVPNTHGYRTDIVEALKAIDIPNLRWPGGCFADDYHWRDGIGPLDQRPKRVNLHWGKVIDTNAFGTHEFLDLCELLGADPYIAGNVGSGTPEEMRDWIEYMTFDGDSQLANLRRANGREKPWKVKYFGIGNENWGCGGQMTPEYYSDLYRRYATFCHEYSGNRLVRIACGPNGADRNWSRVVMQRVGGRTQGLSLHQYTLAAPWGDKLPATGFGEEKWFAILKESLGIEHAIRVTEEEMDRVDPKKRIGLFVDEWGAWYRTEPGAPDYGLYQQNSLRDALLAGMSLHMFHEHNDRIHMANIAQVVNVLQAMILTEGDKMLRTPTYHVFEMFKVHHDATRLPLELTSPDYAFGGESMPALSVSASRDDAGKVHVSIVNVDAKAPVKLRCRLSGVDAGAVRGRVLTAQRLDAHNTFESPDRLTPREFDGASLADGELVVEAPPRSVLVLELDEKK
ncbi:alpha-N-arabinofuranosidase [Pirellulimonas nuda]|uniref:alpha-N-arabinofuranosidase n=1 Tax=Pirellulimonas nuda TaxID=2528009 RepID=UPI0018D47EAF|nr:alpha-N-arabinofuranosidase [Pirellulimonas nuda]